MQPCTLHVVFTRRLNCKLAVSSQHVPPSFNLEMSFFFRFFIIWLNSNTCHPKRTKRAKIVEFLQKSFATSHSTQQTSVHQVVERRVMHIFVFVFYSHLSCMYLYLSRMYLYLYLLHYPRSMLADVSFYPFSS